jgi:hypothetical protein
MKYLNKIAETIKLQYPPGIEINSGHPRCFKLAGIGYDSTMGSDELQYLFKLISRFKFRSAFIIGNAFGLSSAYVALVMAENEGERVLTIDNLNHHITDDETIRKVSDIQHLVAESLILNLDLPLTFINTVGWSPKDLPKICSPYLFDFVIIDGYHIEEAVIADFNGILPYTTDDVLFVFHDLDIPGVRAGYEACLDNNPTFSGHYVKTSWDLGFVTKSRDLLNKYSEVL